MLIWVFREHVQLFAADNAKTREYWVNRYAPAVRQIPKQALVRVHTRMNSRLNIASGQCLEL